MEASPKLQSAFEKIDAANSAGPVKELHAGEQVAKELVYGLRMTAWLERLYPDASEPLQLAARAQHIRRWEIPRDDFPRDRPGYMKWRTTLYKFHADRAAEILEQVGYDQGTIDRVSFLLQKKNLKRDPDTQALEDTICLVFLEHYFADFSEDHPDDKVVDILQKTWRKMSSVGQTAALKLDMPDRARALVERALA
jgi:hypothetical protein